MGMYTEFHYNAELLTSTPQCVIDTLAFMVGDKKDIMVLPDHPLFSHTSWQSMLRSDSYYFAADTISTFRYDNTAMAWFICIRCNLKNYSYEIERFCDWLDPWVCAEKGDFLGFSRHEEQQAPELIFKQSEAET
jgi:hypothetical protein